MSANLTVTAKRQFVFYFTFMSKLVGKHLSFLGYVAVVCFTSEREKRTKASGKKEQKKATGEGGFSFSPEAFGRMSAHLERKQQLPRLIFHTI